MILDQLQHWGAALGGWLYLAAGLSVFGEAAVLVGFVLPGESALLVAGLAAQRGWISLPVMLTVAVLAAVAGDSVGYEVGRRWGPALLASRAARRIPAQRWAAVAGMLERRGGPAVLAGRFTAVLRAVVPGLAGMSGVDYRRVFLPWNVAGALVWGPGCVLLGYAFSASLSRIGHYLTFGPLTVLGAGVLLVLVARHRHRATV